MKIATTHHRNQEKKTSKTVNLEPQERKQSSGHLPVEVKVRQETKKTSKMVKLLSLAMDPVADRHWDSILLMQI